MLRFIRGDAPLGQTVLNFVSGLALLGAASWFSYNLFETRAINNHLVSVLKAEEPRQDIKHSSPSTARVLPLTSAIEATR